MTVMAEGSPSFDDVTRAAVNARRKQLGLPSMEETARRLGPLLARAYRRPATTPKDSGAELRAGPLKNRR